MTTMRRRKVLQAGVALATLPFGGCAQGPGEPKSPAGEPAGGAKPASSDRDGLQQPSASPDPGDRPRREPPTNADSAAPKAQAASGEAEPPRADLARVVARVGKNHGHVFTVAFADVLADADKTYDLAGTAAHPHAVTLTAEQLKTLRSGQILRIRSTEGSNHSHRLWVRCAPAIDPPEWVTACKATFTGKDEHEVVLPAADLSSTSDKTYDVQGIAGHNHQLTLTAADFETLRKGGPVTRHTSRLSDDSHMHQVTIERMKGKG